LTLLAQGRRLTTPCGHGQIVWHIWGKGPPVVLLHGGSGSWTHWLRNIRSLEDDGRMVCVPDLPGFGESTNPPSGNDADSVVAPIVQGIIEIAGQRPVDLVAFSFGSIVGGLLSTQEPRMVRRLVLLGAPVLPLSSGKGIEMVPWRHIIDDVQRNLVHHRNLGTMMLYKKESITDLAVQLHASNVPRDRMRERKLVTTDALARALAKVTSPVWALYGEEDVLYRGRWPQLHAIWKGIPSLQEVITIPYAGHWVQFEEFKAVNTILLRVLS